MTNPRGLVEIGHAMIDCPRCGVPRHVPVGAVCRPVSTSRTATFRVKDGSDEVGRVYVELRFLSDDHRCGPPGKPAPTGPRPVRAV